MYPSNLIPRNTFTIKDVNLASMIVNDAQPDERVGRITELKKSLAEAGLFLPIITQEVTKGKYVILDGHCRRESLLSLGVVSAPSLVIRTEKDLTLSKMFGIINNTRQKIDTKQEFRTWAQGRYPLTDMKKGTATAIREWIKFIGEEQTRTLGLSNTVSPSAIGPVRMAWALLLSGDSAKAKNISKPQLIAWICKGKRLNRTFFAFTKRATLASAYTKRPATRLAERILADEPIRISDLDA